MRKGLFITLIAALAIGTISIAFAQGFGRGRMGPGPGPAATEQPEDRPMRGPRGDAPGARGGFWALDLTDEQKEQMEELRTQFHQDTVELRNELELKQVKLGQLWRAAELDDQAILQLSGEISQLRSQLHEQATQHRLAMAKVLTDDQRAKLGTRLHRRGQRGGQRGFGPGGPGHHFRPMQQDGCYGGGMHRGRRGPARGW